MQVTDSKTFERLDRKIRSIAQLPAIETQFFYSRLTVKEIHKGSHIVTEGKTADCIWYVDQGIFRTYLIKDGKELNTEFFFEDSFTSSFTSFLLRQPTVLNIEALEEGRLFSISRVLFQDLYQRNPLWLAIGKHIFETEFIKKCKRETSFLLHSAKERYLNLLEQYPLIENRVSLSHIASYLGIQPETLSRIRAGKLK
jgi:CRP-like cAMP-binding protein